MQRDNEHSYYVERLSAYVDNELTNTERDQVRGHLEQCPECRARLEQLEALDKLVATKSQLDQTDYWEAAAQKIEAALPDQATEKSDPVATRKEGDRRWTWRPLALAASVLLVFYVGYRQLDTFGDDPLIPPTQLPPASQPAAVEKTVSEKATPVVLEATGDQLNDLMVPAPDQATADKEVSGDGRQAEIPVSNYKAKPMKPSGVPSVVTEAPEPVAEAAAQEAEVVSRRARVGIPAPVSALSAEQVEPILKTRQEEIAGEVDMIASAEPRGLDYWRKQRDSLTAASSRLESPDNKDLVAKAKKVSGVQSLSAPSPVRGGRSEAASSDARRLESELTNIWFEICLLSDDKEEKEAGLDFLRQVAADSTSPNRAAAIRYLSDLER